MLRAKKGKKESKAFRNRVSDVTKIRSKSTHKNTHTQKKNRKREKKRKNHFERIYRIMY